MFEDKPGGSANSSPGSRSANPSPPHAHAASASPFRAPQDLSTASPMPLDLHAAFNNIPKSFGFGTNTTALPNITTPPAIPPPSSKFWDNPIPQLSTLKPPPPPPPQAPSPGLAPSAATPAASAPTFSSLSAASASTSQNDAAWNTNQTAHLAANQSQSSKYSQLLAVLEEMGKDIRPSYAGSKSSAERLKRGIVHARILVREALLEVERASRQ